MGCLARIGCAMLVVGAVLLVGGLQGVYTGVKNTSPTEITFDEYVNERPSAEWLNLKNCKLDIPNFVYPESGGAITTISI